MKRIIIAIVLGFVALATFDSCSKKASDMIVGHWKITWIGDPGDPLYDFHESAIWEFDADGTLRFEANDTVYQGTYCVDGPDISLSYGKNVGGFNNTRSVVGKIIGMNDYWMEWNTDYFTIDFVRVDESISPSGYDPLQALQFEWDGHRFYNGEVVTCTNDESGSGELVQYMQIHNKTDEAKSVVIEKEIIQDLNGVTNHFCWGTCYNADVNTSDPVSVSAQSLSDAELSFHAVYDDQVYGVFIVRYYAYEESHPEDRISITVRFSRFSGETPEGIINGLFTINANGDQVYFSQGNLQYQASTNTWRFAENQWNFVGTQAPYWVTYCCGNVSGSDNANISSTYSGWIDLFGWGTSGYNHGSVCYQPWSTSENNSDYYAYGSYTNNLNNQTGLADWGYNPISNGGNQIDLWRTLSKEEWNYVIDSRQTSSGILYAKSVVNGVRGVVLLPDNWDVSVYALIGANQGSTSFSTNTISLSDWNNIEANGAVFLPITGLRCEGIVIGYYEVNGDYWSSTVIDSDNASRLMFDNNYVGTGGWPQQRFNGRSVRLVQDAH